MTTHVYDTFEWDNARWGEYGPEYYPGFRVINTTTGECFDSLLSFIASFDYAIIDQRYYDFGSWYRYVYYGEH